MKKLLAALLLGTALVTPVAAQAREVTITTKLINYYGPNAYLAIYVTKPDGAYDSTIWVAGGHARYYRELSGWYRGIASAGGSIDGITGASVGPGATLTVKTNLSDAMIDAGYQIRIDSAVEHKGAFGSDAVAPISTTDTGKAVSGNGFVKSVTVSM